MKWKYTISDSIGNENLRGVKAREVLFEGRYLDVSPSILGPQRFIEIKDKYKTRLWMPETFLKEVKNG